MTDKGFTDQVKGKLKETVDYFYEKLYYII